MKVLVVAATAPEIGGLLARNNTPAEDTDQGSYIALSDKFSVLITGVGMVATAFALGRHLATHQYDLLINFGIAGSFDRSIKLGEVVEVNEDTFSELGAENDEKFIPIHELGFGEGRFTANANLKDYAGTLQLKQVSAITVNTVHGNEQSIAKIAARQDAQLESMEGAAFFYVCRQLGVPGLQIRAVSNYVEKRNREAWKIGLAVKNLNTFAVELITNFIPNQ